MLSFRFTGFELVASKPLRPFTMVATGVSIPSIRVRKMLGAVVLTGQLRVLLFGKSNTFVLNINTNKLNCNIFTDTVVTDSF